MLNTVTDPILSILRPIYLLTLSGFFGILTFLSLLTSLDFSILLSLQAFKDHWFARFWKYYGPISQSGGEPVVGPLLKDARGVVLEVGSGTGNWLHLYNAKQITKFYSIEPNRGHHEALLLKARQTGLFDVFELIPERVEDLQGRAGIEKSSIDTVSTLQVLCSIDEPGAMISELYELLKPGGSWLVYEHVKTRFGGPITWYQGM